MVMTRKQSSSIPSGRAHCLHVQELQGMLIVSFYSEGIFQKVFVHQDQTESSVLHRGPEGFEGGCLEKMPRQMAHSRLVIAS